MRAFVWGITFAISSIVLGAFLSHALKNKLSEKDLETLYIAAKYLFYVAVPLIMLSLTNHHWEWPKLLVNAFIVSGCLFSGSLIVYVLTKIPLLVVITPIGGILMIISWSYLLVIGLKKSRF